jgi:hypothetical protein
MGVGFFTTGPQAKEKNKINKIVTDNNFFITLLSKGCIGGSNDETNKRLVGFFANSTLKPNPCQLRTCDHTWSSVSASPTPLSLFEIGLDKGGNFYLPTFFFVSGLQGLAQVINRSIIEQTYLCAED